eukprot:TRINITY_DN4526_c0_g1_i1.p1 TRINITY_DN4526_c0_g1~~TRINITY_DN4526_c0_g1_i1.p1  ORF type:complete len:178 (+),score=17.95 TRINITY_DN4526_c0_g1_i1:116-649(+)
MPSCIEIFHWVILLWPGLGCLIGFSVALAFTMEKEVHNPIAAGWGLISGVYALLSFVLLNTYFWGYDHNRKSTDAEYDILTNPKIAKPVYPPKLIYATIILLPVGIIGLLGGTAGCIYYIIVAVERHETVNIHSHIICAVWAFMTFKWAMTLTAVTIRKLFLKQVRDSVGNREIEVN